MHDLKSLMFAAAALLLMSGCGVGSGVGSAGDATVLPLKTGQTLSYDAAGTVVDDNSSKDDGYYQSGLERNYTRDDINDIVTDNATGLIWQDDAAVSSVTKPWLTAENFAICDANTSAPECYDTSGDTAAAYCADLILGGYDNWRLPSIKEVQSLTDWSRSPALDPVFQNVVSSNYSSFTTSVAIPDAVFNVHFGSGTTSFAGKGTSLYIRCVRSGE